MILPLSPQLLGDLIEKGYSHFLVSTSSELNTEIITLKPVRGKPQLEQLPPGFDTYYKITQEPLAMLCGIEDTKIQVDLQSHSEFATTPEEVLSDSYFRMSEDFFRQVLESLEDYAVITTDKNGDVTSWNTGAERVLGYMEKEIIGRSSKVFFTEEDIRKGEPEKELETALSKGRAKDERFHVKKSGEKFWGFGLVFPLKDEHDNHRGFTKIMRDLTGYKINGGRVNNS
ncbi:PAS domain-containing protein [Rubrolithibacter danxiaensis]|uniref:PAS domain-containing protein n=1 Tax=Rubrolithibacter danxiaensis TaxID=3390805 RepID=UPI003BF90E89